MQFLFIKLTDLFSFSNWNSLSILTLFNRKMPCSVLLQPQLQFGFQIVVRVCGTHLLLLYTHTCCQAKVKVDDFSCSCSLTDNWPGCNCNSRGEGKQDASIWLTLTKWKLHLHASRRRERGRKVDGTTPCNAI